MNKLLRLRSALAWSMAPVVFVFASLSVAASADEPVHRPVAAVAYAPAPEVGGAYMPATHSEDFNPSGKVFVNGFNFGADAAPVAPVARLSARNLAEAAMPSAAYRTDANGRAYFGERPHVGGLILGIVGVVILVGGIWAHSKISAANLNNASIHHVDDAIIGVGAGVAGLGFFLAFK